MGTVHALPSLRFMFFPDANFFFRMGVLWTCTSAPVSMESKARLSPKTFTGIGYIIRIIGMKGLTDPLSKTLWCSGAAKCPEWKCVGLQLHSSTEGGSVVKAYSLLLVCLSDWARLSLRSVSIAPVYFAVSISPPPVLGLNSLYVWHPSCSSFHVIGFHGVWARPFKHAYLLYLTNPNDWVDITVHRLLLSRHFSLLCGEALCGCSCSQVGSEVELLIEL